jgi:dTDP-4-amino-4,6-dideoxygalactose transaminase
MSTLALLGGDPVRTEPWPTWPDVREEDVEAVAGAVRSGKWWQYEGDQVRSFEQEFASYHDAAFSAAVNSGTTALQIALEALEIGPGDEVIVPAYTFQGTAAAVLAANAVPVFADVEPRTMNMDPDSAAALITPRTRAFMPVHLAGLPADLDRLGRLAASNNLHLIEDAAQAHGAVWRGRKVGSIADAGEFSFQASKNLPSGEGGIVLTNDERTYARAAGLRDCGRVAGRPFYEHHLLGFNYRLTECQGALLRSRLRHLEVETDRRFRNGRRLTERLSQLQGIEPLDPAPRDGDRRAYHLYPLRIAAAELGGLTRERFMQALRAEGIPCSAGYERPLYRNPVFLERSFRPKGCPLSCGHYGGDIDYSAASCPAAERLCEEVLWLFHSLLLAGDSDLADIVRAVEKIVEHHTDLLAA